MFFISSKVSDGNMDFRFGDPKQVLKNRNRFFKKAGVKNIIELTQVHGNKTLIADKNINPKIEADGLITNRKSLFLMIKLADCMAISLYDTQNNAIGLIHAGFRGLEKGIIKNAVLEMTRNFKTDPKNLVVKISPSIGPCHYKTDIWTEAENQLTRLGVLRKNIYNPKICTYESLDYFSHRRSDDTNTTGGRFVTILGL